MHRSKSSTDTSIASNTDDRITQRKVIEAKKEEKKRLEDASCTFQPTMSARRGRENLEKPVTGSRFDYLYKDAVKRKTEGPKVKESDENHNTFKPNISPRARSMSTDRTRSDLIDNLHKGTGVRTQVKEIPKAENLFTPKINKRADSVERSSSSVVSSRLYASRTNQEENLQRKKGEVAAKEALECTFSPKLTRPRSMSRDSVGCPSPKPVIDRLLQYGTDKKNKLAQDKQSKADKDKLTETFQPAIIRSKFSPAPKDNGTNVHERLAQPLEKGKEFTALLAAADADLTFQPTLPKTRTSSVKLRAGSISGESIHERLFREAEQKRCDLEEERRNAKAEEDKKYTYSPTIPVRASFISDGGSDNSSTASSSRPAYHRLSTSKTYMQNILSQIKDELELNECTFQPTISQPPPGAHRRSSEGPVHERLLNDASKIRKDVERRESMRLNAEIDGMSFHPSLPETSKGIVAVRRKSSLLCSEGDDQSVSTMTTGNVYERLSNSHTISSLGGHADSDLISVTSGSHVGREKASAVVDRLMAAGDKHKEDLKNWEEMKASEEVKGATFSPQLNEKSVKIALKIKETVTGNESEPADFGPMASTRRKSMSRIPSPVPTTPSQNGRSGSITGVERRASSSNGPSPTNIPLSKSQSQSPTRASPGLPTPPASPLPANTAPATSAPASPLPASPAPATSVPVTPPPVPYTTRSPQVIQEGIEALLSSHVPFTSPTSKPVDTASPSPESEEATLFDKIEQVILIESDAHSSPHTSPSPSLNGKKSLESSSPLFVPNVLKPVRKVVM